MALLPGHRRGDDHGTGDRCTEREEGDPDLCLPPHATRCRPCVAQFLDTGHERALGQQRCAGGDAGAAGRLEDLEESTGQGTRSTGQLGRGEIGGVLPLAQEAAQRPAAGGHEEEQVTHDTQRGSHEVVPPDHVGEFVGEDALELLAVETTDQRAVHEQQWVADSDDRGAACQLGDDADAGRCRAELPRQHRHERGDLGGRCVAGSGQRRQVASRGAATTDTQSDPDGHHGGVEPDQQRDGCGCEAEVGVADRDAQATDGVHGVPDRRQRRCPGEADRDRGDGRGRQQRDEDPHARRAKAGAQEQTTGDDGNHRRQHHPDRDRVGREAQQEPHILHRVSSRRCGDAPPRTSVHPGSRRRRRPRPRRGRRQRVPDNGRAAR